MNALLTRTVGGALVAILPGAIAIAARKGGSLHAFAGTWFFGSMLVLGATASILARPSEFSDVPSTEIGRFEPPHCIGVQLLARNRDRMKVWWT